jgi:hypothetical protein
MFSRAPPPIERSIARALADALFGALRFADAGSSATSGARAATIAMILRALLTAYGALLCASLVDKRAKRGVRKVHDAVRANAHLVASDEKRWKRSKVDPKTLATRATKTRTVVFIRHGESTWNEVFNRKFDHTFPVRLIGGVIAELGKFFARDSFFLDSPLSATGVAQARALRAHFATEMASRAAKIETKGYVGDVVDVMLGLRGKSVIASSNLRRAVNTTAHALWCRLSNAKANDKIIIHSALQEMARNVDTYALACKKGDFVPTQTLAKELGVSSVDEAKLFDASSNAGQKKLNRKGRDSMREFAAWVMNQDADVVIAGGHSIWFREFFKTYLPFDSTCPGKKKKIVNCGVVSFDLSFGVLPEHGEVYAIENVKEIYGGFAK